MPACVELNGVCVLECPIDGPLLESARDAVDLMSMAAEHGASFIVIPAQRLGHDFFDLRTRIAGEVQKFVTYGSRVSRSAWRKNLIFSCPPGSRLWGDISARIAKSKSLAAFVTESNRGHHVWFVESMDELSSRLAVA